VHRQIAYGVFGLLAVFLALSAHPTFGQSGGTVTATVQVQAAACITISPTSFTYTAAGLSPSGSLTITNPSGTKPTVTSCSAGSQNFVARGNSATGGGFTWTLTNALDCSTGTQTNEYRHQLNTSTGSSISLTTTDQTWEMAVPAGNNRTLDGRLTMPCTGSNGVGQTMSMPIIVTAVVQ
jgi:hypothetical protein